MNASYGKAGDWRTLAGVAALHVVALAALLSMQPVADAVGLPQPLLVSLLSVAEPEPPKEPPMPLIPKPRVVQPEPAPAPPVLAAREEAPAPIAIAAPPELASLPVVLPAPAPAQPVAVATPAPVAPAPTVPPRFDADYLDNPAPAYPNLSRRLGEHGRVLLRVFVSPEGTATQVEIRESSGYERLDKTARDTVRRWRFVPAKQGDHGVAAWVLVPISFSIRS